MGAFSSGMEGSMTGIKIQNQKSASRYQDTKKLTNVSPNT